MLPSDRRIELGELAGQRFERRIGDLPNHGGGAIRPNPLLQTLKVCVAEKDSRKSRRYRASSPPIPTPRDHNAQIRPPFFSTLLV
jgi:hypothetical protein